MNERIKELAEQTEKWIRTTNFEGMPEDEMTYDELYNKKFAELIVRECAKIASGTQVDEPPNDLFYGYNLGVNKAAENIKQHFGVSE